MKIMAALEIHGYVVLVFESSITGKLSYALLPINSVRLVGAFNTIQEIIADANVRTSFQGGD